MLETEVYAELTKIFHDTFDDQAIVLKPQTSAADIPNWDSLNHIDLIAATESAFHVKFTTANVQSMETVGDLVALIQQKLGQASAKAMPDSSHSERVR